MVSHGAIRAGRAYVEIGVHNRLDAGLRRAQVMLRSFGLAVQRMGLQTVRAAAVAAVPAALAVRVGAQFEQRMARVRALAQTTEAEFTRLATKAKQLGKTTIYSAGQVADAMSYFALAGYRTEQILDAIGPTLALAAAGQLDVAQAADIAAKTMAGLGIGAERVGYAMDVLTKAMTTANTDLVQLGDAMKYVGPVAKSAKIAFEEIVAAVQLLSNAGIQGEMAGSTLRGVLLALTSPSAEAREKLKELGVAVNDAEGNVRPLAAIIADLQAGLAGLGSGARLDALGRIFQARQTAGIAELLTQGAGQLQTFTAALRGASGTSARIAATQLNTLAGSATILKSALEGLGIAVAETLGPPLRVMVENITRAVSAAANWARQNRELIAIAGAAIVALGGVGGTLLGLGVSLRIAAFAVGAIVRPLLAIGAALVTATAPMTALAVGLGTVVAGIALAQGRLKGLTAPLLRAADAFMQKFGQLRRFAGQVVQGISDAFLSGQPELAAKILWLGLEVVFRQGSAAVQRIWAAGQYHLSRGWYTLAYGMQSAMQEAYHGIEVAAIEMSAALARGMVSSAAWFQRIWHDAVNSVTKRFIDLFALFDSRIDADQAKAWADEENETANTAIARQRAEELAAQEQRRADRREQARRVHETTLAELGQAYELDTAAAEMRSQAAISASQRQLEAARQALRTAINTAGFGRAVQAGALMPLFVKLFIPGFGNIDKAIEALNQRILAENATKLRGPMGLPLVGSTVDNAVESALRKVVDAMQGVSSERISVLGTFSGTVAGRLGVSGPAERTARGVERLVNEVQGLRGDVRNNRQRYT